ncbi:MAG TPA: helix-turn-helix transcriptional regulator [Rhizomicrobium sp.]|nr:helix-turn-helix transcriptional regulator [Rhizomicrobium sp.]
MKAQTITSPSGDELVVLPRAEYEALLAAAQVNYEDADDIAIYDARKAEFTNSGDARLPQEVTALMLRGDSLLKALRKWKDLTQMHLSFRTGLAQGYISDLEAGRRKGAPDTLTKIAEALQVPAEWLTD